MSETASKLTSVAFAFEQYREAEKCLDFLRSLLGTYNYEQNPTVQMLEGYRLAMLKVQKQDEL